MSADLRDTLVLVQLGLACTMLTSPATVFLPIVRFYFRKFFSCSCHWFFFLRRARRERSSWSSEDGERHDSTHVPRCVDMPPLYFTSAILSCAMWGWYGALAMPPDAWAVRYVNAYGLGVSALFLFAYVRWYKRELYARELRKQIVLMAGFCFGMAVANVVLEFSGPADAPDDETVGGRTRASLVFYDVLGWCCSVLGVLMYLNPIFHVAEILRTKNCAPLGSLGMNALAFLNTASWTAQGFLLRSPQVIFGCGFSAFISSVALGVRFLVWVRGSRPGDEQRRQTAGVPGRRESDTTSAIALNVEQMAQSGLDHIETIACEMAGLVEVSAQAQEGRGIFEQDLWDNLEVGGAFGSETIFLEKTPEPDRIDSVIFMEETAGQDDEQRNARARARFESDHAPQTVWLDAVALLVKHGKLNKGVEDDAAGNTLSTAASESSRVPLSDSLFSSHEGSD